MTLAQLKEKRGTLYNDMRAMLDTAAGENRELTAEEGKRYDALEKDFDNTGAAIGRQERMEERGRIEIPKSVRDSFREGNADEDGRVLLPTQRLAQRPSGLSLSRTLRAILTGDTRGADAEVRALGISSGGSSLIIGELAAEVLDFARSASVTVKAGAVTLPMHTSQLIVPKLTRDITAAWRAENAVIGEDVPAFAPVTLVAKSLSTICRVSKELLDDSPLAEAAILHSIGAALGLTLDQAVLAGSGVDPIPLGIKNTVGIGAVDMGVNGAAVTNYDNVIDAAAIIMGNNRTPNAYVMAPRTAMAYAKLKSTQGEYLEPPTVVAALAPFSTTSVSVAETHGTSSTASSIYVGDFRQVAIGLRQDIQITRLVERYADFNQIGFLAIIRADVACLDAKAFALISGVTP